MLKVNPDIKLHAIHVQAFNTGQVLDCECSAFGHAKLSSHLQRHALDVSVIQVMGLALVVVPVLELDF